MNPIDEFLKTKGKVTQKNYRWILNQFFSEIKQNPETYFKKKRDYKADIEGWWNNHINEVPKTRNTKLGIVRGLFDEMEMIFPKKFWLKLRKMRKGSRASTLDRVPIPKEFKEILLHGTIKDRALYLFIMSSGMRIGEVLQLNLSDAFLKHLEHDPPLVKIPATITKTGNPRITFITPEAKEYVLEWLKIRKQYIRTAIKKSGHIAPKNPNDDRIFPFSYDVAWRGWLRLLKKSGLDERDATTNNYVLHIHCLRKYFLSQLKLEIPITIAEALAGHEEYLDEAYRRFTQEQLGEYYKKGMKRLFVFERTPDLTETHKEINELKREKAKMQTIIEKMQTRMELLEMKLDLEKVKNGNK